MKNRPNKPNAGRNAKASKLVIKEEAVGLKAGTAASSGTARTSQLPRGMCSSAAFVSACPGGGCSK